MSTKLIELADGILVEVEIPPESVEHISASFADRVDSKFQEIKPVLLAATRPVVDALSAVRQEVAVEEVEIELGLSFETEGNIYVAKASVGANLVVRMKLKTSDS